LAARWLLEKSSRLFFHAKIIYEWWIYMDLYGSIWIDHDVPIETPQLLMENQ